MPGTTTTRPGSNGRRITREDLQAAYSQVIGEGEATARAAAPQGLAVAGAVGILRHHAGLPGRPPAGARQVGRRRDPAALTWTCSCGASCAPVSGAGWPGNWAWFLLAVRDLRPAPGPERPDQRGLDRSRSSPGSRCSSRCATATPVAGRRTPDARAGRRSRRGSGSSSSTPRTAATSSPWCRARRFHTHAGVLAHDDIIGGDRGVDGDRVDRAQLPRAAPHPERHRAEDAPRGPGHLPQGPRRHPHRGRHRPGPACARGGRRVGRPVHDRAAGRRVGRRLRAARGLRRTGPGQRGGHARSRRALPGRDPRRDRGHRRDGPRPRSCSTCPSPTRWSRPRPAALRPGGILLAYLPTINQTALLRQALDDDDAPFGLAETQEIMRRTWHVEAPLGPPGPPHGGAHRIPHHGAAAGADRGRGRRPTSRRSAVQRPLFDRLHGIVLASTPTPRWRCPTACRPTASARGASTRRVEARRVRLRLARRPRRRVRAAPPRALERQGDDPDQPRRRGISDDELRALRRSSLTQRSVALDEDALAGALLGGLDDRVLEIVGHERPCRPSHPGRS